jgi:short-subunit dehydrogenase
LDASGLGIEFLVNNAGAGILGPFAETGLDAERDMMHLHMTSVVELSKLLLGPMLANGSGRILNVASTAGFQPGPGMAVYYASKAFLISFSEAVRDELRNTGVTVTVLCPGPTRSGFLGAMGVAEPALVKVLSMSSGRAAVAGYRAMMKGRRMAVPGLLNRLGVLALRFSPRGLVARVVGLLQVVRKGP